MRNTSLRKILYSYNLKFFDSEFCLKLLSSSTIFFAGKFNHDFLNTLISTLHIGWRLLFIIRNFSPISPLFRDHLLLFLGNVFQN